MFRITAAYRSKLPSHIVEALEAYVNERRAPTSFLFRALVGDLFGAAAISTMDECSTLGHLAICIRTELDPSIFGSVDKLSRHLSGSGT